MLAGDWQNLKSEVLNAEEASKLMAKWQSLSLQALESTGFNAPELILPTMKHLKAGSLSTVYQGHALLWAMPFQLGRFFNSSWVSLFSATGTPHIAKGAEGSVFTEFLANQTKPFLFRAIVTDGLFDRLLKSHSQNYGILESWKRACLRPVGSYQEWLQTNFDQKRRKEFKRLRNRLGEQGDLKTEFLRQDQSVDCFIDNFMALESAGWKGKRGTAIGVDATSAAALRESLRNLHAAKKLRFWQMLFNGKTIASLFAITEGNQAWLGKIAYDEAYSKYSPGVLIILDCTESFFSEPAISQIDSRAVANHPMIDRIWRDRISMVSAFAAPATIPSLKFKVVVAVTKLKLNLRNGVRDFYYKLKGKQRS